MPSESVDFALTSPPYDNLRDYGNTGSVDLHAVGVELFRLLKPGGVVVMVIQDQTKDFAKSLTTFRTTVDWCDNIGFRLFECLIWGKNGLPGPWWNTRFRIDHEYMPVFLKGDRPRRFDKEHLKVPAIWAGTKNHGSTRKNDGTFAANNTNLVVADKKCRGTIWHCDSSKSERDAVKLQHPATFPDQLSRDHIQCWTQPGDVVLDPFCGSGTVLKTAEELGRNSVGIEIYAPYCDIIKQRLAQQTISA